MKVDVALPYRPSLVQTRAANYLQLVRPRLALLVLATVAAGWLLAAGGEPDWLPLVHALVGTALLFAGASTLNQLLERHRDALMPRMANRLLPAGRLQPGEVLALGSILSAGGVACLLALRQPMAAGLGAFARQLRLSLHSLEKPDSPEYPDRCGTWCAATDDWLGLGLAAALVVRRVALFLIVFLWQVPHSLAIA
jgi:protoheme IX farnesyltransferase